MSPVNVVMLLLEDGVVDLVSHDPFVKVVVRDLDDLGDVLKRLRKRMFEGSALAWRESGGELL